MADPKRPSPRERVDRAAAAVRPAVDRARAKAEPQVEKAAARAGSLFGQLRDRARETAKSFGEGYKPGEQQSGAAADPDRRGDPEQDVSEQRTVQQDAAEPRRRPRPGPR